jgi:hypothetical protein
MMLSTAIDQVEPFFGGSRRPMVGPQHPAIGVTAQPYTAQPRQVLAELMRAARGFSQASAWTFRMESPRPVGHHN